MINERFLEIESFTVEFMKNNLLVKKEIKKFEKMKNQSKEKFIKFCNKNKIDINIRLKFYGNGKNKHII